MSQKNFRGRSRARPDEYVQSRTFSNSRRSPARPQYRDRRSPSRSAYGWRQQRPYYDDEYVSRSRARSSSGSRNGAFESLLVPLRNYVHKNKATITDAQWHKLMAFIPNDKSKVRNGHRVMADIEVLLSNVEGINGKPIPNKTMTLTYSQADVGGSANSVIDLGAFKQFYEYTRPLFEQIINRANSTVYPVSAAEKPIATVYLKINDKRAPGVVNLDEVQDGVQLFQNRWFQHADASVKPGADADAADSIRNLTMS